MQHDKLVADCTLVKAKPSHIVLQLIHSSDKKNKDLAKWNETVVSMRIPHLWQAMKDTLRVS